MATPDEALQVARAALDALPGELVALEALWDGDSGGWRVELYAVLRSGDGHAARHLWTASNGDGDIRIFQGRVPPWPESAAVDRVGAALAAERGVPFWFPAPDWPEDDCPHWWERADARPCATCGIPLLQRDPCPWRGVCYRCHLAAETARREAALTPEERALPKCRVCSKPATEEVWGRPRCRACVERYEDFPCATCGRQVMVTRGVARDPDCGTCRVRAALGRLTDAQRSEIRALAPGVFHAILRLRALLGLSLHESQEALWLLESEELPPSS